MGDCKCRCSIGVDNHATCTDLGVLPHLQRKSSFPVACQNKQRMVIEYNRFFGGVRGQVGTACLVRYVHCYTPAPILGMSQINSDPGRRPGETC